MEKFWLFLDDERMPPDNGKNWKVFRKVGDLIEFILVNPKRIAGISFDHDLGEGRATGYDAVSLIYAMLYMREWLPEGKPEFVVHSANPVGERAIKAVINSINELFL